MRLTFFGSSLLSAYWNGAATYYRGLLAALARRGHEIVFCEPDAFGRQAHRDLQAEPDYARVFVYSTPEERDRLVAHALAWSDWVFKCSGVGIWDEELEAAVAAGGTARTAFWDVDAPATLARMATPAGELLRRLIPRFDHVFSYGGGPPVVAGYLAMGARACEPVYNGLDPETHRREEVEPAWDVLFMGNRLPDRDERVREFFIGPAVRLPEHRFALGGCGWSDVELPPNVARLGHVPTGEHNRLNASSRLVLNIHRAPMVRYGWSPATRMFEAAGAGACQITDAWKGIDAFFEPAREVLVARNGGDVVRFVKTVSAEQAERIGDAACARALREHTYDRRAGRVHERLMGVAHSAAEADAPTAGGVPCGGTTP